MKKMYAVVGCPNCNKVKIIETDKKTTTCPYCNKKHKIINLQKKFETNSQEKARIIIGYLHAKKDGNENIFINTINETK